MRIIGLVCGATLVVASAAPALAASARDCGRPPPAFWNAPRVTYTYSGSSYASTHTHSFSAQRRYVEPRRSRVSYTPSRW